MEGYICLWIIRHCCLSCRALLAVPPPLLFFCCYLYTQPVPLALYGPTVDFRFFGFSTRVYGPVQQGTPFLSRIIVPYKACGKDKILPQTSHYVKRFKGTMSYPRRRFSCNSSLENSMLLRQWGISVSHAPFYVACQRRFSPALSINPLCLVNTAFYKKLRCFHSSSLTLHTQLLCTT